MGLLDGFDSRAQVQPMLALYYLDSAVGEQLISISLREPSQEVARVRRSQFPEARLSCCPDQTGKLMRPDGRRAQH
jgi:hypothetical protein